VSSQLQINSTKQGSHRRDAARDKSLCTKSTETLKQHKIDELSLKASLDEANLMLEKLEKIGDGLRSEMFNKSIVKFVKKKEIEADQIGKVKFQNVDLFFLENLTNYVQLDLKLEDYCD
jgi:hypothetical protein